MGKFGIADYKRELSPEMAYKFFNECLSKFPEADAALKKALLLPNATPKAVADIFESWAKRDGLPFPEAMKVFAVKALEHMQFLAQVEAGTFTGDKETAP